MDIKAIISKINLWLEPKCDLCGFPDANKNPLLSDGVGLRAHQNCWDKSDGIKKRRRR